MRWFTMVGTLCGLAALAMAASPTQGKGQPLVLSKTWKGSVKDATLQKSAPEVITNTKALEELWKSWKIDGPVPPIDFSKEIVLIATTVGSQLNLSATLDDKGNVNILAIGTADFGEGFRYVMATVGRDGVKTVNKKELPK
jgi:hypothetical protein